MRVPEGIAFRANASVRAELSTGEHGAVTVTIHATIEAARHLEWSGPDRGAVESH